jgi:hypothetical protein
MSVTTPNVCVRNSAERGLPEKERSAPEFRGFAMVASRLLAQAGDAGNLFGLFGDELHVNVAARHLRGLLNTRVFGAMGRSIQRMAAVIGPEVQVWADPGAGEARPRARRHVREL